LEESGNMSLHRLDIITLILEDLAIRRSFLVPCNKGRDRARGSCSCQ
jgi:hypothetical protein